MAARHYAVHGVTAAPMPWGIAKHTGWAVACLWLMLAITTENPPYPLTCLHIQSTSISLAIHPSSLTSHSQTLPFQLCVQPCLTIITTAWFCVNYRPINVNQCWITVYENEKWKDLRRLTTTAIIELTWMRWLDNTFFPIRSKSVSQKLL